MAEATKTYFCPNMDSCRVYEIYSRLVSDDDERTRINLIRQNSEEEYSCVALDEFNKRTIEGISPDDESAMKNLGISKDSTSIGCLNLGLVKLLNP